MLLEGPQQTTGSIGQTWKTGNGRSRLVLTGQHKHTPPPPPPTHQRRGPDKGAHHPPHTRGGTRHRAQPRVHYADHHQPTPHPRTNHRTKKTRRGPEDHNHPQHHRATPHKGQHPHAHHTTPPHVSVVIAGRQRPDPSRTRKLRPPAPMVLRPPGRGRAGHHRAHTTPPTTHTKRRPAGEKTNNNTTTPDQETCHRLTGRLIQKQIPPQPKDHIHVPGQARQSVALPQCTFSW